PVDRFLQVTHELGTVRKVSKRIVERVMEKLVLGLAPRGDVTSNALNSDRGLILIDEPRADLEYKAAAVLGNDLKLIRTRYAAVDLAHRHLLREFKILRSDDLRDVHSEGLIACVAREAFAGTV